MSITAQQQLLIEQQLGRPPRGIVDIAWQTPAGVPGVLQMRSLIDDQPFPTLFWLCSKDLYQAIAEIETAGWVKQLEQQIQEDATLRSAHLADQQAYVQLRWQHMMPADRARIAELGFSALFDSYGIGGIRHWDKVRCLHMQYAYHLAVGGTAIGRQLDKAFGLACLDIQL